MAVSAMNNKHRHMISTVIFLFRIRQIYSIYYLSVFPVFFPRPVPTAVSYVSAALSLTRYAGCIFRPGIILGRLFIFQGASVFNLFTYQNVSLPLYNRSVKKIYFLFLCLLISVSSISSALRIAMILLLIILLAAC